MRKKERKEKEEEKEKEKERKSNFFPLNREPKEEDIIQEGIQRNKNKNKKKAKKNLKTFKGAPNFSYTRALEANLFPVANLNPQETPLKPNIFFLLCWWCCVLCGFRVFFTPFSGHQKDSNESCFQRSVFDFSEVIFSVLFDLTVVN